MEKRIDIMTDIETLGNKKNVAIIQLSAVAFNIETGNIIEKFNEYVDISCADGLIIDGSTLKWWMNTDANLLKNIINSGISTTNIVLSQFNKWFESLDAEVTNKYLWGNGILFDNRIIQEAMSKYDISYPIYYSNDRDVRTILELACIKEGKTKAELLSIIPTVGVSHNALDDCLTQINIVCECYKILMK